MATCNICGEPLKEGSQTCSICGSREEDFFPAATGLHGVPSASGAATPQAVPKGGSWCPACAKVYNADHVDPFCACGTELIKEAPRVSMFEEAPLAPILEEEVPLAPILDDIPMAPILEDESATEVKQRFMRPAPGTPCIVLYGADKQPLRYFGLEKDATLIGRLDAVAGSFPDIDLEEWFDRAIVRRISRQHALILRSRATHTYSLRPLAGNTGTQLETSLVQAQQDYPLRPGHRIILGGVIRMKFDIA